MARKKTILLFLFGLILTGATFYFFLVQRPQATQATVTARSPAKTSGQFVTAPPEASANRAVRNRNLDPNEARFIDIVPYHQVLIREALANAHSSLGTFIATPVSESIPNIRVMAEAVKGEQINMFWGPDLPVFDRPELFKINIPLLRGLTGCRILMIRQGTQAKFNNAQSLDSFIFGLGHGWAETHIYEAAGLSFDTAINHAGLYNMLSRGRYDAIPYGADIVYKQLQDSKRIVDNLTIEKQLLIYYPMPQVYYVSSKYPALADALERGLRTLQKNGRMDKIFEKYHEEVYTLLNLDQRRIFEIDNPELSEDAPVIDSPCRQTHKIDSG